MNRVYVNVYDKGMGKNYFTSIHAAKRAAPLGEMTFGKYLRTIEFSLFNAG